MKHSDFRIGVDFWCGGTRWRCTDLGSRVIVAISLEPHEIVHHVPCPNGASPGKVERYVSNDASWLVGPPYAVVERVFDEYDLPVCSLTKETVENGISNGKRGGNQDAFESHGNT
jgi:hypothetical protein